MVLLDAPTGPWRRSSPVDQVSDVPSSGAVGRRLSACWAVYLVVLWPAVVAVRRLASRAAAAVAVVVLNAPAGP